MKKGKSGFTLIELLVVISIIAILSSIVLAALSNARNESYNASIQEQIAQLRIHLLQDAISDGSYPDFAACGGSCTSLVDSLSSSDYQGLNIQNAILSINKGTSPPVAGSPIPDPYTSGLLYFVSYANSEVTNFAIFGVYQSSGAFGSAGYYCADSSGKTTSSSSISSLIITFSRRPTGTCF